MVSCASSSLSGNRIVTPKIWQTYSISVMKVYNINSFTVFVNIMPHEYINLMRLSMK